MTWFVVFLLVTGLLILSLLLKAAGFSKRREKAEKDRIWNEQLDSLLQSLKRE